MRLQKSKHRCVVLKTVHHTEANMWVCANLKKQGLYEAQPKEDSEVNRRCSTNAVWSRLLSHSLPRLPQQYHCDVHKVFICIQRQ